MPRPWYTYPLLAFGILMLLVALGRPAVGVTSVAPGGLLGPKDRIAIVRPGSPLERAGAQVGDTFVSAEYVVVQEALTPNLRSLQWRNGIPRSGNLILKRGESSFQRSLHPVAPTWPVRFGWWLVGVLNFWLVALALALFWQRPRDGSARLLGMVLLSAPVFAFPREPPVIALALFAHFYTLFPPVDPPPRRLRLRLFVGIYLPLILAIIVAGGMQEQGRGPDSAGLLGLVTLAFALYSLIRVMRRRRHASAEEEPLYQTLILAAAATLAAALIGILQPLWLINDQFIPANLLPASLFAIAVGRLVFRLRAMEVRLVARKTLQYLLARWTLGTLLLGPGLILVWLLGRLSVTGEAKPVEVFALLLLMLVAAMLLRWRHSVLRNIDRRFFRDAEMTRQRLVELAADLGGQPDAEAVLQMLESGVREALHPNWLRFSIPDAGANPDAALAIPLRRREHDFGYLELGPREADQAYGSEERGLLAAACGQAAMALENARLSAALLARQREELSTRTAGVLAGAEEERRRLAADLHDQVLPELRQIAAELDRIMPEANGIAPDLKAVEAEVRGTMDSVREVMEALRPSALDMLGLSDALESYLRKGAARCSPPMAVSVRRMGEEPELTQEQSLALYRICQEAMNNVFKHSGAARAGLEITNDERGLSVAVWDDGRGVDADAAPGEGHGLGNMRYRADLIGAEVSWSRPPAGGTCVEVRLVFNKRTPDMRDAHPTAGTAS